jgi:hypothetical protein
LIVAVGILLLAGASIVIARKPSRYTPDQSLGDKGVQYPLQQEPLAGTSRR